MMEVKGETEGAVRIKKYSNSSFGISVSGSTSEGPINAVERTAWYTMSQVSVKPSRWKDCERKRSRIKLVYYGWEAQRAQQ